MADWKQLTVVIIGIFVLVMGLTGCGAAPTARIFDSFEEASTAEADVAAVMQTLSTLEAKDSKQYNHILSQGKQDNRNVQTWIDYSIKALEERKQAMEKLKVMLDDARKELGELGGIVNKLQGEGLKKLAEDAYHAYVKRYEAFTSLYEQYGEWIRQEQMLYDELKQKNTKPKAIRMAVSKRNETYRQVEQFKKQFNYYTNQFNEKKRLFYKQAGLQISQSGESIAALCRT